MSEPVAIVARTNDRLLVLDYLRLFAALSVIGFHYLFQGIHSGRIASITTYSSAAPVAKYGYLGVHLFFLISGYVIFNSARQKNARQFVVGRAIRLLPAFWVAMCLTAAVVVIGGSSSGLEVSIKQVLINLTMVPDLFGAEPVDGVYWTLLLEVQFYFLVFLFIVLGRRHLLSVLLPWWAIGMLVLSIMAPGYDVLLPYVGGYFALFAAGALIAEVEHGGLTWLRGIGLVASAVVAVRFSTRLAGYVTRTEGVQYSSGIIAAVLLVFVAVMLCLNLEMVRQLKLPGAALAGALTYPLYLVHANVGYILLTHFGSEERKWVAYSCVFAAVVGSAVVINVMVERRMKVFWFGLFNSTVGRIAEAVESGINPRRG